MKKLTKLGNRVMGKCVDCKRPCLLQDEYIVRADVWQQAGMTNWGAGYLHRECLETRIGRALTDADYLVKAIGTARKPEAHVLDLAELKKLYAANGIEC